MPNIGISTGVYVDQTRRAYFFAGKGSDERTLYHEATHQLFHESRPVSPEVVRKGNFWIIEGIAMFMESLRQEDGYCVLGGFDDERMHAARYRLLHDHFYVPLDELVGYDMEKLQKDPRIGTLYSQSAGLTHFLVFHGRRPIPRRAGLLPGGRLHRPRRPRHAGQADRPGLRRAGQAVPGVCRGEEGEVGRVFQLAHVSGRVGKLVLRLRRHADRQVVPRLSVAPLGLPVVNVFPPSSLPFDADAVEQIAVALPRVVQVGVVVEDVLGDLGDVLGHEVGERGRIRAVLGAVGGQGKGGVGQTGLCGEAVLPSTYAETGSPATTKRAPAAILVEASRRLPDSVRMLLIRFSVNARNSCMSL